MLFHVKRWRGHVGLPKRIIDTLKACGVPKINSESYMPVSEASIGALLKIRNLIRLDIVTKPKPSVTKARGYFIL